MNKVHNAGERAAKFVALPISVAGREERRELHWRYATLEKKSPVLTEKQLK